MGDIRNTLDERQYDKFVESPTRPGKTAVESVVSSSALPTGAATAAKQDQQTALLTSIDNKVATAANQTTGNNSLASIDSKVSTFAEQQVQSTILNAIYARLLLILNAILGVLNIRNLVFATDKVDVSGSSVSVSGITKEQTYSAAVVDITVANVATDIFTIQGSATKKIKIVHISINGIQQNISKVTVLLVKRSTLNTGGTSTDRTAVPHSSLNAAATGIVKAYTANPTVGNLVGTIQAEKVTFGSANGSNISDADLIFEFGRAPEQEIILENQNELLAVNLNGQTLSGNLLTLDIRWTEV